MPIPPRSRFSGSVRAKNKETRTLIEQLETRTLLTGTLTSTVAITDTIPFIAVGGSETFTATITPTVAGGATPTGTVQFFSYNGTYPSQTISVDSSGVAQLPLTGTIPGYMAFIAQYSGDANYADGFARGNRCRKRAGGAAVADQNHRAR